MNHERQDQERRARPIHSCDFQFTVEAGSAPNFTGSVHLLCANTGDSITITIGSLCTIHIPAQTPTTNEVDYTTNETGGLLIRSTAVGIHSKVVRINPFFCPLSTAETDTSGVYEGTFLLEHSDETLHIG